MSCTVIKLGSSVVSDDDGELRLELLERVCADVARVHGQGTQIILVTSGAIACGTRVLGLGSRPSATEELQAASAVGQGRLYQTYDQLLAERGVIAAQVLLTFSDISNRSSYLNSRQTLRKLLDWGVVPVINENDTTATDEISFGDNDLLAAQIAILVAAERLIILTNGDGLYSADPQTSANATLVDIVDDFAQLAAFEITQTTSTHGSGGMRSKVMAADMATSAGIETVICNGARVGVLARVLANNREGTLFSVRAQRYSSFKLWLRYAKPSCGTITVDSGAARALREGGSSLLPVGIVKVGGQFYEGDAVDVFADKQLIGKGICNYSSADLRRAAGQRSSVVHALLPRAAAEAIHRDYFILA